PSIPVIRKAEDESRFPNLLFPHDGAAIKRSSLTFRWQRLADAVSYEISIITTSGDVIVSQTTEQSSVMLPPNVALTVGSKYFVSIRAHMSDGKTARS